MDKYRVVLVKKILSHPINNYPNRLFSFPPHLFIGVVYYAAHLVCCMYSLLYGSGACEECHAAHFISIPLNKHKRRIF